MRPIFPWANCFAATALCRRPPSLRAALPRMRAWSFASAPDSSMGWPAPSAPTTYFFASFIGTYPAAVIVRSRGMAVEWLPRGRSLKPVVGGKVDLNIL